MLLVRHSLARSMLLDALPLTGAPSSPPPPPHPPHTQQH